MLLTDAEIARVAYEAARVLMPKGSLGWDSLYDFERAWATARVAELRSDPNSVDGSADDGHRVFAAVVRALDS